MPQESFDTARAELVRQSAGIEADIKEHEGQIDILFRQKSLIDSRVTGMDDALRLLTEAAATEPAPERPAEPVPKRKYTRRDPERATAVDPEPKPPEAQTEAVDGAGSSSEAAPAERGGGPATESAVSDRAGGMPATQLRPERHTHGLEARISRNNEQSAPPLQAENSGSSNPDEGRGRMPGLQREASGNSAISSSQSGGEEFQSRGRAEHDVLRSGNEGSAEMRGSLRELPRETSLAPEEGPKANAPADVSSSAGSAPLTGTLGRAEDAGGSPATDARVLSSAEFTDQSNALRAALEAAGPDGIAAEKAMVAPAVIEEARIAGWCEGGPDYPSGERLHWRPQPPLAAEAAE